MSPAPSPATLKSTQVTFTVKVDGKQIDETIAVQSISTWWSVNKVPKAELVLFDGSAAQRDFPLSNAKTFLPGNRLEVAAGYLDQKEEAIFDGVIARQGIRIDREQGSKLVVEATDEAIQMTLERRNALFEKIKDSDLIGKLITNNGLKKKVESTTGEHAEIVQYYASDWDLMMTRAQMNGFVVVVDAGTVEVGKPDTSQTAALKVEYGESVFDLEAEMDAATQFASSAIKSYSWDPSAQKVVEAGPGSVSVKEPGNVSSAELAKVFNVKKFTQQSGGSLEKTSLQEWSSAELLLSKLSKIRGNVTFQGSALARVGKTIELAGLGQRFNGVAYVSGVHQSIRDGVWTSSVDFGLSPRWFAAEAPDIAAPDASGQLPPIKGLQTGVVKKIAKDPDGEFRVQVNLPLLEKSLDVWARLGSFYASKKVGAVFYPEVGDEVVVGFMNEDPRYPVILGSVYSKKLDPPYPPDDKNKIKAIVTKNKLELVFDDQDKIVTIKTPAQQTVTLDDKKGEVSIQDKNKNKVMLSKSGVTVDSGSNLKMTAKGNVTISANGNLSLSAKGNATMDGTQVTHSAKAKFAAKGNAAAEVTSSGMLTVRGTLVKIN